MRAYIKVEGQALTLHQIEELYTTFMKQCEGGKDCREQQFLAGCWVNYQVDDALCELTYPMLMMLCCALRL